MTDVIIVQSPQSTTHGAEARYRDGEGRTITVRVSALKSVDVQAPFSRLPKDWTRLPEAPMSYAFAFFVGGFALALALALIGLLGFGLIIALNAADWLPDVRLLTDVGGYRLNAAFDLWGFAYCRFALIAWPLGMVAILLTRFFEGRPAS